MTPLPRASEQAQQSEYEVREANTLYKDGLFYSFSFSSSSSDPRSLPGPREPLEITKRCSPSLGRLTQLTWFGTELQLLALLAQQFARCTGCSMHSSLPRPWHGISGALATSSIRDRFPSGRTPARESESQNLYPLSSLPLAGPLASSM